MAPWRWAALLSNAGARLFWGDVNFKGPARPGSIARGMDENVLFDAHVLSTTERVVFFTVSAARAPFFLDAFAGRTLRACV